MSDDNNQKSRGPRKGAGGRGGGRDGGPTGGRPPGRGGKPPFRKRDGDERPRRAPAGTAARAGESERPARRFEKAPFRERPTAERAPREGGGERPFRQRGGDEQRASRGPREGERPRGERPAGKGFGGKSLGAKGFGGRSGESRGGDDKGRAGGPRRFEGARAGNPRQSRPDRAHRNAAEIAEAVAAPAPPQGPERIAKVMARAGVASRRDSEALIAEGRVSVNGKLIESPALDVGPEDVVLVDGEPLPARERTRLWLYHKPRGLVTTNHDPEGRPTVFDALPEDLPRVLSVGRLDINTEGLLLLTNDGGLARMLELPETGWLRRYRVRAFGQVTQDRLDTLRDGVTIEGVQYGPVVAQFEREQGANTWLTVDLREGKNREVKTVLEHLGLQVNRLIRISFGPFQLGDLAEGEADEVRSRVLKDQLGTELMAKAGTDFESPRRDENPPSERPARGKLAPAGDDRPRRRPRHEDQAEARPARGDKPWTKGVWRDAEAEPQRGKRAAPRRGADPKEERQARQGEAGLQRVRDKPIADPKGRRVKVERVSARPKEEPRERRAAREDEMPGRDRGGEAPWRASGDWAEPPRAKRPPRSEARERPQGERPGGRGPRPGGGGRPPRSGPPRSGPPRSGGGGRRGG
jgi:23S rRNA pseudouridine2605 synthase